MADEEATPSTSPFDAMRHQSNQYGEYWSGKELYKLLGYSSWERFKGTIERAKVSSEKAGQAASDHFHIDVKMVKLGSGATRKVEDVHLSRYACYLTLQNADPNGKPVVGMAQTYFAVQTRRQELSDEEALASLAENQRRLLIRGQLTINNIQLTETASQAGVITARDFAIFQDHGYQGLYNGLKALDIHQRKGLKRSQKILDHMNGSELAANLFRVTQTEDKIRREAIAEKEKANGAHHHMGKRVREFIAEEGGIMPEDQPNPAKSIQQLKHEEQRRVQRKQQPSLFPEFEAGQEEK